MMSSSQFRWYEPATWPLSLYLWLGFVLAGLIWQAWKWLRRVQRSNWPSAEGTVISAEVVIPGGSFTAQRSGYLARLHYRYAVEGNGYSGVVDRDCSSEDEAEELVRALEGESVAVHYNPGRPAKSAILDTNVDQLADDGLKKTLALSRRRAESILIPLFWLRLFAGLAGIGLVVSLGVHMGALFGRQVAPDAFFWLLHVGAILVWFPAVFVARQLVGTTRRKDFWKAILRDCPVWMRYMCNFFFGYAILNFIIFFLQAHKTNGKGSPSPLEWRGFSGHWMAFYSAAMAILYVAIETKNAKFQCVNGHVVSADADFCATCGQPIAR